MSEPAAIAPVSISASGFEDGLGRRTLEFDRETGTMLERLHLRPELRAFTGFLQEQVALAEAFDDERFARVRGIERNPRQAVTVVSQFVSGHRLCDLLEAATNLPADEATSPSVDAALGFLLEILPALGSLHSITRHPHGTLGPGRIVLTHDGRVIVLEAVFGQAIERLQFNRSRLWLEFGLAAPAGDGPVRLDNAADIAQASLVAMMIVIGRPLRDNEYPDGIGTLLTEVIEIAQIRGGSGFAAGLQSFLARALPLSTQQPFESAEEATSEVRRVAKEIGATRCRAALTSFVGDMNRVLAETGDDGGRAAASYDDEPFAVRRGGSDTVPSDSEEPSIDDLLAQIPSSTEAFLQAESSALLSFEPVEAEAAIETAITAGATEQPQDADAAPEVAPVSVEPPAGSRPAPPAWNTLGSAVVPEPIVETAALPPAPTPAAEAPVAVTAAVQPVAAPEEPEVRGPSVREPEPVRTPDPVRQPEPPAAASERQPAAAPVAPPRAEEPPAAPAATPMLEPEVTRAATPAREPEVIRAAPVPEPDVARAAPAPEASKVQQEAAEPPSAKRQEPPARSSKRKRRGAKPHRDKLRSNAAPKPMQPPPVIPMPVPLGAAPPAPPLNRINEPIRQETPRPIQFAGAADVRPPVSNASAPLRLKTDAPSPLRLKTDGPSGFTPPPQRAERREPHDATAIPYVVRPEPDGGGSPWRMAAIAAAVLVVVVGAAGAYMWGGGKADPEKAPTAEAAPAPVKPSDPTKVGTLALTTQPAGAHVLIDGKAVGETPVTLSDLAPGKHALTIVGSSGSVKKVIRIEAGKTLTLEVPIYSGWIAVFAPVPLDIAENGKAIGTTDQGRLMLSPGLHQLTLSNRQLGYKTVQIVDIEPGEERSINVQPTGGLNANAVPWAEVWMAGKKIGETPIAGLQVPLGTHEILFKNPQFPEKRVTVTVTGSDTAIAAVDFTK